MGKAVLRRKKIRTILSKCLPIAAYRIHEKLTFLPGAMPAACCALRTWHDYVGEATLADTVPYRL